MAITVTEMTKSIKLICMGACNTGKTQFTNKYLFDLFSEEYHPSIKVEGAATMSDSKLIKMYSMIGNKRYDSLSRQYYFGTQGAFIFCNFMDIETLEKTGEYIKDIKIITENIPFYLIINKIDIVYDNLQKYLPHHKLLTSHMKFDGDNLIKPELEFNELLEQITPQFNRVFRVSVKKTELNETSIDNIVKQMIEDIEKE